MGHYAPSGVTVKVRARRGPDPPDNPGSDDGSKEPIAKERHDAKHHGPRSNGCRACPFGTHRDSVRRGAGAEGAAETADDTTATRRRDLRPAPVSIHRPGGQP